MLKRSIVIVTYRNSWSQFSKNWLCTQTAYQLQHTKGIKRFGLFCQCSACPQGGGTTTKKSVHQSKLGAIYTKYQQEFWGYLPKEQNPRRKDCVSSIGPIRGRSFLQLLSICIIAPTTETRPRKHSIKRYNSWWPECAYARGVVGYQLFYFHFFLTRV